MDSPAHPLRGNPVFWLIWILLGSAVIGGLATVAIALDNGDRELPANYHWEGERLDEDFARLRAAADRGVEVSLSFPADGECAARLHASDSPAALQVLFVNGNDVSLDQVVRLTRDASGDYRGTCRVPPEGRWRVAIEAEGGDWAVRARHVGSLDGLVIRARHPEGAAP